MSGKVLITGLLGGLAMFVWTSTAHMLLPLGQAGVRQIPGEQPLLRTMHSTITAGDGLYLFPQMTTDQAAYANKLAESPSGFLVYHAPGATLVFPRLLAVELVTELAEALIIVFLLSLTRLSSFSAKIGFVTLGGVAAAITTNISYWNWYGFPTLYTASYMTTEVIGYLCVGLVAAAMLRGSTAGRSAGASA